MTNYIIADIKRVFLKKSFITFIGIYAGIFLLMMFIYSNPTFTAGAYVLKTKSFLGFFPLLIGLAIFLSVYYDDFKSKSMQTAIGYGISRHKIVISKFTESIVISILSALSVCIIILITPMLMKLSLSKAQSAELILGVVSEILRTIGYISISAVPAFYTQNAISGTILYVLLSSKTIMLFLTIILGQDIIVNIFGNLSKYIFTQQIYSFFNVLVENSEVKILSIIIILIYMLLPVLISAFSFNKKELEF